MKRINIFLCIVIIFSCIAGYALLQPGLPPTHDGEYHVVRFYEFDNVLRSGSVYPRWAPDLNKGYGVPLFNYVYPLPNYIASFLHVFGISFIDAFKLNMFIALMCGAIFFYLWSKMFWGNIGGAVSSIFYTYAPYHFLDIYIRGSVGEVWALAFFPAFLWSITKCIKQKKLYFSVLAGVFLAMVIFSHNILAVMFLPFAVSYVLLIILLSTEKLYALRFTLYAFVLGLSLSAIFWFPALMEKQYVTGLQIYNIEKNFPEIYQLFIPSWGTGFSEGNLANQMSFQIGIANLFAVLVSFGLLVKFYKNKNIEKMRMILFFIFWFCLLFFLMLKPSLFLWQQIPLMDYFQFPWRLLSLIILVSSFLAGAVFLIWNSKILAICFVLFSVLLSVVYTKPAFYHQRDDSYYISRSNFIDGTNSPGDLFNTVWFNKSLEKQKGRIVVGHGRVADVKIIPTKYLFRVEADLDSQVTINTAYFPGWKAKVNKKEIEIKPDNNGLIVFFVPKGINHIELVFSNTFVRIIAMSISVLSFFSVLVYSILHFRNVIFIYEKK